MSTWSALYLPSNDSGWDPSKSGFTSYRAARKWVRKKFVNGPCGKGCASFWRHKHSKSVQWCYWIFIEDEKLSNCNNLGDIFDNADGFTRIS